MTDFDLEPGENDLVGAWVFEGGRMLGDPVEERINHLIKNLEQLAVSPDYGGWERLYRDPKDGRFWELTYPKSEMHGGGPKRLTCLSEQEAATKYHLGKFES